MDAPGRWHDGDGVGDGGDKDDGDGGDNDDKDDGDGGDNGDKDDGDGGDDDDDQCMIARVDAPGQSSSLS